MDASCIECMDSLCILSFFSATICQLFYTVSSSTSSLSGCFRIYRLFIDWALFEKCITLSCHGAREKKIDRNVPLYPSQILCRYWRKNQDRIWQNSSKNHGNILYLQGSVTLLSMTFLFYVQKKNPQENRAGEIIKGFRIRTFWCIGLLVIQKMALPLPRPLSPPTHPYKCLPSWNKDM